MMSPGVFGLLCVSFITSSAIPIVNLSPERKAIVEANAVARASAQFKVVVAAVLSGNKVRISHARDEEPKFSWV